LQIAVGAALTGGITITVPPIDNDESDTISETSKTPHTSQKTTISNLKTPQIQLERPVFLSFLADAYLCMSYTMSYFHNTQG
jgi:hypothetical protein